MQNQNKSLNLLMAIHCHQPVSNFAGIFQNAYEKAYLPFLDVFERFSDIKISLHYSGSLLDWLIQKHPEFIKRLKALVKENRIEIIGGGYFEPILTTIPFRDAVGQITMFRERIREVFGQDFKGIWLTERVWEPRLPYILSEAGVEFTIVDDCHFNSSHKNIEQLNGYYLSEEESRTVSIFPGSEKLRYLLPFKLPAEAIDYLRERLNQHQGSGGLTVTFADDGEKFGLWPGTNKWVYRENWLSNFFTTLEENRTWISTLTFSEFIKMSGPTGRAYLPCSSYREMQEWSGGFFRNFFIKYPEANNLQKKMFLISDRFSILEKKRGSKPDILALIRKHLYMGQFNDTYWHGVFGGLYLTHLRSGAYENLIKAENLIEEIEKQNDNIIQCDYDRDGKNEIVVFNNKMRLYFKPEEGATISEWDDKTRCLNLTNTISRRFESYHEKLKEKIDSVPNNNEASPVSIHDQKAAKEAELDKILFYDIYPRYSLRDYLLTPDTKLDDFFRCSFKELAKLGNSPYEFKNKSDRKKHILEFSRKENMDSGTVNITKTVTMIDNSISIDYCLENLGPSKLDSIFGSEFNLSLYDSKFCTVIAEEDGVFNFVVNDLWKGAEIDFCLSPNARVWHFPIETVTDSEQGIERTYQELCLFFNWPISLEQGSKLKLKLDIKLS